MRLRHPTSSSSSRSLATQLGAVLAVVMLISLVYRRNLISERFNQSRLNEESIVAADDSFDQVQLSSDDRTPAAQPVELIVTSNEPPNRMSNDHTDVKSRGQDKRGYESMITQLAKPLQCVQKSRWRGPSIKSPSVEERLEEALLKRAQWDEPTTRAIEYCGNGIPMMQTNEYGILYHLLRPNDLMLEWGSGRSSCVWANVVGELHSVDDSSTWVNMFRSSMTLLENQVVHWMPSFEAAGTLDRTFKQYGKLTERRLGSDRPPSSLDEYHLYLNLPFFIAPSCFKENNVKFDVILVDGRVRPQCAYQALLLLKRDGVLIIHDWETQSPPLRPFYRIVLRWFELLHTEGLVAVFRIRPDKTPQEHHANPGQLPEWWTKKQAKESGWSMIRQRGVAYTEPFRKPQTPTDEQRKQVLADWNTVKSSPGFVWTNQLFAADRT